MDELHKTSPATDCTRKSRNSKTQYSNTVQEKLIIIPFHVAPSVLLVPLQARLLLDLHIYRHITTSSLWACHKRLFSIINYSAYYLHAFTILSEFYNQAVNISYLRIPANCYITVRTHLYKRQDQSSSLWHLCYVSNNQISLSI